MKKSVLLFAAALMMVVACSKKEEEKPDPNLIKLQDMEEKYQDATSVNDSLLLLMGDIYDGLDAINEQEGLLMTPGVGDDANRRELIQKNLEIIKERLAANRALLAELQKKVNASQGSNKVLNQTITELNERIDSQEAKIADLTAQLQEANEKIENLNEQVEEGQQREAALNQQVEETEAQNVALQNDLNRVYYVVASNKELKKWGVLEEKFLRSTKVMQGNVDYSCFVQADKRKLTSIPTNSKKIEIKSNMSPDTYEIVGAKDENKTIRIKDPDAFWQKTNYLVVETK